MTSESRQLWQWLFGHFKHLKQMPPFNPAKAEAVFRRNQGNVLFYTAVRSRGLWLRLTGNRKASAMTAVMELSSL